MSTLPGGIGRYQRPVKRALRPLFRLLWRFEVTGLDHVPDDGPAVLCPNHRAAIDSFFLPVVLDREVIFVGKAEYLDDWKTRRLFPGLGMIPIDRRGGDHAAAALASARSVLEGGGLFAIYPEGTRSRSGRLHKGHTGAARLALETGAPIIPVGLVGTAEVQPVDAVCPRPFRPVGVHFGEPVTVDRYRSRIGDHTVYRQITDEVMFEIQSLTGQEYDPTYAGSSRPVAPAGTTPSAGGNGAGPPDATPDGDGPASTAPRSSAEVLGARPLETSR